jgi:hypothetical protein
MRVVHAGSVPARRRVDRPSSADDRRSAHGGCASNVDRAGGVDDRPPIHPSDELGPAVDRPRRRAA